MKSEVEDLDLSKCAEMLSVCVCLQLRKTSRTVTQVFDEMLRQTGLLSTQLPFLVTLSLSGPTTITSLAEQLAMDRTSVTRHLKPLERQGLITIAAGQDRRTREVSVTARGQKAVVKAIPLWEEAQSQVVKKLGQNRVWHLRDLSTVILAGRAA